MHPLVSVIIPSYNYARYVCEAVNSVLSQTWQDFEIIVVDDGSTDNTREILAPFKDKIKYIYQVNQGLSAARNTGIKEAVGEWIALLDADDLWIPNKLDVMMRHAQNDPAISFMCSDGLAFDENGIIARSLMINQKSKQGHVQRLKYILKDYIVDSGQIVKKNIYEELVSCGNTITVPTCMFKKECVEKVGMFGKDKHQGLSLAEDYELWLRIARFYDLLYVNRCLVKVRILSGGISGTVEDRAPRYSYFEALALEAHMNFCGPELRNKVKQRAKQLYFDGIWLYLKRKDFKMAQKLIGMSLSLDRFQGKLYVYWFYALMKSLLNNTDHYH